MKNKQESGHMVRNILCGPILEVSPLHRDCFVAYCQGDTKKFLGISADEAIGKCFREYALNFGPITLTYQTVNTPIRYSSD